MAVRATSWLSWPSLLRAFLTRARLTTRLMREPAVPLWPKTLPVLTALYVLSPFDLIPDVMPVLGQLDDLGIILIALDAFVKVCPSKAVDFHRVALTNRRPYTPMPYEGEVIDAEYRREDDRS